MLAMPIERSSALRVAPSARDITLALCPNVRSLTDEAFLAGLLHDVGQVVLAGVSPMASQDLERQATAELLPLRAVKARQGLVSHAIVGAYLLSLWRLSSSVVEAVACHHTPERLAGWHARFGAFVNAA
jgi:HD-like signal output (HDOD) protein